MSASAVLLASVALAAPATAAEPRAQESSCVTGSAARSGGPGLRGRDHADLPPAETRAVERRLDRALQRTSPQRRRDGARLAATVPVHVHVIDGTSQGPTRAKVLAQVDLLQRAFDGNQSNASEPTDFNFSVKTFERVTNQRWRTALMQESAHREMKRRLHDGGPAALNIYFTKPRTNTSMGVIFGWSSFPWQAADELKQDGVTLNVDTMPGGSYEHYDLGDTLVHEVGHWMGLYHTFQGGCAGGDFVSDTAKEDVPQYECQEGRDTCAAPGVDPIHNFMDYSWDSCMYLFTAGQVARMDAAWLEFRAP